VADASAPAVELSILIPALNEAATVADVVRDHARAGRALGPSFEILVCDDGSTDPTWAVLERLRAEVPQLGLIRNQTNIGITRSMKRLFAAATGTWWYFAPADGQVPAEALERMWTVRDGAAVVVGRRVPRRDARSRVLMARLYSTALRAIYGLPVHDIDSVKLYDAAELRRTGFTSLTDFFQAELLIAYRRNGRVLREVVIPHRARVAGRALGVTPLSAVRSIRDLAWFIARDLGRQLRR
jgi:glycosyltransferase involved in cell wall biosynthesis